MNAKHIQRQIARAYDQSNFHRPWYPHPRTGEKRYIRPVSRRVEHAEDVTLGQMRTLMEGTLHSRLWDGEHLYRFKYCSYPTMCGGKLYSLDKITEEDYYTVPNDCEYNLLANVFDKLPEAEFSEHSIPTYIQSVVCGIVVYELDGELVRAYPKILEHITQFIDEVVDACEGEATKCTFTGDDGSEYIVLHHLNQESHDSAAEGETYDECSYCGTELDDGYCYSCEEDSEPTVVRRRDDDEISDGIREAWIEANHGPRGTAFKGWVRGLGKKCKAWTGFCSNTYLDASGLPSPEYSLTLVSNDHDTKTVNEDDLVGAFATQATQMLAGGELGCVAMSSDVGNASGLTATLMAMLFESREELEHTYGLLLHAPEGIATNPNEGYHYIDSLYITSAGGNK